MEASSEIHLQEAELRSRRKAYLSLALTAVVAVLTSQMMTAGDTTAMTTHTQVTAERPRD